jgi:hypothetical protein
LHALRRPSEKAARKGACLHGAREGERRQVVQGKAEDLRGEVGEGRVVALLRAPGGTPATSRHFLCNGGESTINPMDGDQTGPAKRWGFPAARLVELKSVLGFDGRAFAFGLGSTQGSLLRPRGRGGEFARV